MDPKTSLLPELLAALVAGEATEVAYGHNYLFEECVSPARQERYEDLLSLPAADLKAWKDRHRDYPSRNVFVGRGEVPETFDAVNVDAQLSGLDTRQWVVRVERFDEVVDGFGTDVATVHEQLAKWDPARDSGEARETRAFLEELCAHWNGEVRRQDRPAFGAFFDDVEPELGAPDWADRLRNRLGLSHYHVPDGGLPLPVALVRYRVEDVLASASAGEAGAFAVPTVLDGELNSHFFPAPREVDFGRTLGLEPDPDCERLVAEILHRRIDYGPEHLLKVGWIRTPLPPHTRGPGLARLRDGHLFCLRYESDREDFGANLPEVADG